MRAPSGWDTHRLQVLKLRQDLKDRQISSALGLDHSTIQLWAENSEQRPIPSAHWGPLDLIDELLSITSDLPIGSRGWAAVAHAVRQLVQNNAQILKCWVGPS